MSEESSFQFTLRLTTWLALFALIVVFLPLGLAVAEHFTFGSDRVEEFCKHMGVFDTLDHVYQPFVGLFR